MPGNSRNDWITVRYGLDRLFRNLRFDDMDPITDNISCDPTIDQNVSTSHLQNCQNFSKSSESVISLGSNICPNEGGESDRRNSLPEVEISPGFRKYLGLGLTFLSGFLYSLTALCVTFLKDEYHPFMISIWRFQGVLLPSLAIGIYRRLRLRSKDFTSIKPSFKELGNAKIFFVLMFRGAIGSWSVILQFYSLIYLQVADSLVITSSTSVFVTLLAHFCLGESCAFVPVLTTLITMFGVFVISRPPMLTGQEEFDTQVLMGVAMALGCMILAAGNLVMQRYLKSVPSYFITLSSGFWGSMQCIVLTIVLGVFKLPETIKLIMQCLSLALLTFFAQTSIILALKFEKAGPVAVAQSCDVIFAFLWQFLFMGIVPDALSLIGSSIVISGVIISALRIIISELPQDHPKRKKYRFLLL